MTNDPKLKVVVAGDAAVGKTCLISRMLRDIFDEDTQSSISIAINPVTAIVEGQEFKYSLWDTAGQEKYRTLSPIYFREAIIGIIVYDITSKISFEKVEDWYSAMISYLLPGYEVILIGNKSDLENDRQVSLQMGSQLSEKLKTTNFLEVSAKTGQNIVQLKQLIDRTVFKCMNSQNKSKNANSIDLTQNNSEKKKVIQCCK